MHRAFPPAAQFDGAAESMSPEHRALYARLAVYSFDAPGAPKPYSQRLAEREGWSATYTEAVMAEYKRFAFLAVTSEHMAAPSKAIDAAWHLHLEYTREYWDVFCAEVLLKKLHHTPGTGAPEESAFYARCYEQTIERYRAAFGAEPPASIWPREQTNAADAPEAIEAQQPVQPRKKRALIDRLRTLFSTWPAWLATAGATGAYASETNVLNYAGPQFLVFYFVLSVATLLTIYGLQKFEYARRPRGARRASDLPPSMTVDEVAYVTGGPMRMAQVATLWLIHAGAIELTSGSRKSGTQRYVLVKDRAKADRFDRELAWLEHDCKGQASYETFRSHLMERAPAVSKQLAAHGWLWSEGGMRRLRYVSRTLAVGVIGIGGVKVVVGLLRDRPVSFLVIAIIAFVIAYLRLSMRAPGLGQEALTASGREAVAATQERITDRGETPDDLLWLVALTGVSVLAGTAWSGFGTILNAPPLGAGAGAGAGSGGTSSDSSSSCSSGSSSCSSSSCGSSGCGGCSSS